MKLFGGGKGDGRGEVVVGREGVWEVRYGGIEWCICCLILVWGVVEWKQGGEGYERWGVSK